MSYITSSKRNVVEICPERERERERDVSSLQRSNKFRDKLGDKPDAI